MPVCPLHHSPPLCDARCRCTDSNPILPTADFPAHFSRSLPARQILMNLWCFWATCRPTSVRSRGPTACHGDGRQSVSFVSIIWYLQPARCACRIQQPGPNDGDQTVCARLGTWQDWSGITADPATAPSARGWFGFTASGGVLYLFGGVDASGLSGPPWRIARKSLSCAVLWQWPQCHAMVRLGVVQSATVLRVPYWSWLQIGRYGSYQ